MFNFYSYNPTELHSIYSGMLQIFCCHIQDGKCDRNGEANISSLAVPPHAHQIHQVDDTPHQTVFLLYPDRNSDRSRTSKRQASILLTLQPKVELFRKKRVNSLSKFGVNTSLPRAARISSMVQKRPPASSSVDGDITPS